MKRRKKKSGRKPSLALSRLLAQDPSGETMRAIAMGFKGELPRTLAAIPPGSPLDAVLDHFRQNTPIGEELPLFGFIALVAQFLAQEGVKIQIPHGTVYMDLYLVLLAKSGELKTFTTNRLLDSVSTLWKPNLLPEPGSSRGFLDAMAENDGKPVLWMVDEFGKFWDRTRDEAGAHGEWARLIANPLLKGEKTWRLSPSGDRAYGDMYENLACSGLGHSFVRRLIFRAVTYAACFHLICGKGSPEIDGEDIKWAERLTMINLSDLKVLLGTEGACELERMMMFGELVRQKKGPAFEPRHLKARFKDKLSTAEDTRGLYLAIILKAIANGATNIPLEDRIEDLTGVRISELAEPC